MGDVVTALGRAVQEEGHDVSVVRIKPEIPTTTPPFYIGRLLPGIVQSASAVASARQPSSAAASLHQPPESCAALQQHAYQACADAQSSAASVLDLLNPMQPCRCSRSTMC